MRLPSKVDLSLFAPLPIGDARRFYPDKHDALRVRAVLKPLIQIARPMQDERRLIADQFCDPFDSHVYTVRKKTAFGGESERTGVRTPCVLIDRFKAGLKQKLIESGTVHSAYRCGITGVVRSGGQVAVGDPIAIKFPPRPWRNLNAL
jgi:hypothetical protein